MNTKDWVENMNVDDGWKEILQAINQLTEEELKHIGHLIKQK